MTIPELIVAVLGQIRRNFYPDRLREFMRDRPALLRAISRYGHLCVGRGWNPSVQFIYLEIFKVLESAKRHKADIRYLPAYLDVAIGRAIGERAEEIKAASRETKNLVAQVTAGLTKVEAIRQPTRVEILDTLYKSLHRPKCPKCHARQQQLL